MDFINKIAAELNIKDWQVKNTLKLIEEGGTVPFISRYRKENTGSLDEEQITNIRDLNIKLLELEKRRETILKSIEEQGKLDASLKAKILAAENLSVLEDLYLPYKPKRRTRGMIAREKGLKPLAVTLMDQGLISVEKEAANFVNSKKGVESVEEALAGARDIIAEWVNENAVARAKVRRLFEYDGKIRSKQTKTDKEGAEKYRDYFKWDEDIRRIPSHRYLALMRGENEGFLKVDIRPAEDAALDILEGVFVKNSYDAAHQVSVAIEDSYKRLIAPSMETELRQKLKLQADEKAIDVFAENLRQLLMGSPLGQKNVLALDPGFRTGCKVVCLDKTGRLLHNETIYPHPPKNEKKQAIKKILSLVSAYKIEAIAIGNGTAGRETEDMIRRIRFDRDIIALMVNESGASIYSASKIAREEFPEYDVTVRGAVSIGRRLQDPLAELVKIDPKSIGVGQYQHDVDQKSLGESLEDTVVSCVNQVGVEVNTASKQLLTFVSGLGPVLADNIIQHRKENGPFKSRDELKEVKRFGPKAFEQAAGFLRVRNAVNTLDNTAVHPEAYKLVGKMAKDVGCSVDDLVADKEKRSKISPEKFVDTKFGLPTIHDILKELEKPGRDPRSKFELFEFDKGVNSINDLEVGMVLPGIVTNITAFGAFVDVGVHQDGLVHISQLADEFISDVSEFVKLNQKVQVKVLEVDVQRKRIQLSMKGLDN